MTTPKDEAHDQLRAWARGVYPSEAATELLIRAFNGRFAEPGWPWIHSTAQDHWIDFSTIPRQIAGLSGGEQRLLRIAASIGSTDATVNLGDCLTGLTAPDCNSSLPPSHTQPVATNTMKSPATPMARSR